MTIDIDLAQREALRRLSDASDAVIRIAGGMAGELAHVADECKEGHHLPSFSNQPIFDLKSAYTKREMALEWCHRLQVLPDAITQASKGGWGS